MPRNYYAASSFQDVFASLEEDISILINLFHNESIFCYIYYFALFSNKNTRFCRKIIVKEQKTIVESSANEMVDLSIQESVDEEISTAFNYIYLEKGDTIV